MADAEEYWSIDVPGMTHQQAPRLQEVCLADAPWGVTLSDPKRFMVRHADRATVELLVTGRLTSASEA